MSNNCLVTKLKEAVNNSNLSKLGILSIQFLEVENPTANGQGFIIKANPGSLATTANGHFTNSSLSDNLGTEVTLNDVATTRYVSNGSTVNVNDKYNLSMIRLRGVANPSTAQKLELKHIRMDVSDLEYSSLTQLLVSNTSCYGDITTAMRRNSVIQYADLDNTDVSGDISVFDNKSNLIRLLAQDSDIEGDVTGCFALPALTTLKVSNCHGNLNNVQSSVLQILDMKNCLITGNVTFLNNLSAIKTINLYDTTELVGDINDISLPSTCTTCRIIRNLKITGSIATFRANNPNCTTVDFSGCSNVTT